jgi:hypothetical protein
MMVLLMAGKNAYKKADVLRDAGDAAVCVVKFAREKRNDTSS